MDNIKDKNSKKLDKILEKLIDIQAQLQYCREWIDKQPERKQGYFYGGYWDPVKQKK
mgnify:CR=1 FL=1|tara:strand:- start:2361 stop:2531 length:171 start_codon:yes stop_codon:yes gene_type:complete